MLKQHVRGVIRAISPAFDGVLHARGMRKHFRNSFQKRQQISKRKAFGGGPPVIVGGPFAGMFYLDEVVWGPIEPKWFGTYEAELHAIVSEIVESPYRTVVDVGSAEGYYSVGLAYKMPGATVYSFDIDPWARAQQKRLAQINSVTNLNLGSRCTASDLDSLNQGRSLLICDIEGGEYDLLDPGIATSLSRYDILVEMHSSEVRGLNAMTGAAVLAARFQATHAVQTIAIAPRSVEGVGSRDKFANFSAEELAQCLDEGRGMDQCWLWLKAQEALGEAAQVQQAVGD